MIKTDKTLLWLVCLVMALGVAGTAWGDDVGHVEFGGDGECSNDACRVDAGGAPNPQPMCDPGPCDSTANFTVPVLDSDGGDFSGPLNAMADQFEILSPGFDSIVVGSTVTFDALDPPTICVRTIGDAISLVGVEHPLDYLNAKIRKVTEMPEGGMLIVWLNANSAYQPAPITVVTRRPVGEGTQADIDAVNADLVTAIGWAGYQFVETADYIIVKRDQHLGSGWDLNQVSFETADPGITIIEVALEGNLYNSSDCD